MFRLEGYCDDKNVAKIMIALQGLVIDFKMQPVANVGGVKNGKVVAKTKGDTNELLADWIGKNKLSEVSPAQFKQFMAEIGKAPGSYSKYLQGAIKARLLKRMPGPSGNKTTYRVIK